MRQALYNIAVIALCSGILELFSPSEKMKKHTAFALSLIITLSLLQPLYDIISAVPSKLEFNDHFQESEENEKDLQLSSALEEAIELDISSNLKIPRESFSTQIRLQSKNGELTVSSVTVNVTDSRYFRYCERLEAYLNVNYGCEISVKQNLKEQ